MKCQTKYCRRETKSRSGTLCSTCQKRRWRQANKERDCFHNLKSNAKRRGKEFDLTFDQFIQWCRKVNMQLGSGKTRESWTVDRKDPNKGYEIGNLQKLTLSENSSKGNKVMIHDWQSDYFRFQETTSSKKTDDDPF